MEAILEQVKCDVSAAAVAGSDGVVWYVTPGFVVNSQEFRQISEIFGTESKDIYNGFKFQGTTFAVTELTPNTLAGESNSSVIYIFRSEEFFVLAYQSQKRLRDSCLTACKYVFDQIKENKLYE